MFHRNGPSAALLALALVAPARGVPPVSTFRPLPQGHVVSTPQNNPPAAGFGFATTPLTGITANGIPAPVYNPPINPFTNGFNTPNGLGAVPPNATLNGQASPYSPYFMNPPPANSYGTPSAAPYGGYPSNSFNDPRLNPYLYNPLLGNPYLNNPYLYNPYLANPNLNNPMFAPNIPAFPGQ